ncbi:MAG: CU044_2847 family protein [Actinomycetota bacterium]
MSEVQRLLIEAEGDTYEIYVESKETPSLPEVFSHQETEDEEQSYSFQPEDVVVKMQEARRMIRGYALYTVSAFKDFGLAKVEQVTLKFGMKMGGKAGIPYITEGSADCNVEIEVKCTFPDKTEGKES